MAPSVRQRPKARPRPVQLELEATGAEPSSKAAERRIAFAEDVAGSSSRRAIPSSRRTSSRSATVQAALETQVRVDEAEARRLQHHNVKNPPSLQKRPRMTQADLIELALNREEENRKSLKRFLGENGNMHNAHSPALSSRET